MGSDRGLDAAGGLVARELGKYRLLAVIGRGGMGEVYLAMARGPAGFRKLVVLKCMNAASSDDVQLRKMFLDEAMLAARLSHPNVVQTYESGELDGTPYIAMEYLEGQPLSRLMQAVPAFEPRLAAHLISEALAGLHYAHQLKDFDGTPLALVHRDLSPPNIFVTYDGVVKVVDFGVAKTAMASRTKTEANVFKGKIAYTAPEQAMHDEIDHRADIFSLGAVLWELVAGKRLFREISPVLTLKRLLQDEIPSLSSEKPNVDPALDAIVMRALQRNPNARYQTALQMRQDLERYVQSGPSMNGDGALEALVSEKFARQREKVQRQVKLCMAQEAELSGRLPSVTLNDTVSNSNGVSGSRPMSTLIGVQPPLMDISPDDSQSLSSVPTPVRAAFESGRTVQSDSLSSAPTQITAGGSRLGMIALAAGLVVTLGAAAMIVFSSESGETRDGVVATPVAQQSAPLEVLSTPPGAVVFVDGEPSGLVTPAVLTGLAPGRVVTLRVDKAGYRAAEERVSIEGQALTRSFVLQRGDGLVRFEGAPEQVRVFVDNVAVTPNQDGAVQIPVGSHQLRLETRTSLVFSKVVDVVSGEQTVQVVGTRGTP